MPRWLRLLVPVVGLSLLAVACKDEPPPGTSGPTTTVGPPVTLEFRPVLALVPGPDCPADTLPELDGDEVIACYSLGPNAVGGEAIETAEAVAPSSQWVVNPVFTEAGIDEFNEIAATCFGGEPACPTKQLAIVVDDVVISAPTINEPSFERDQITISGNFTEETAKELAAQIRAGT